MKTKKSGKPRQRGFWSWKSWWVYPQFQGAILGVSLGVLFVGFGGMGLLIANTYRRLRQVGGEVGLPSSHPYFQFIDYQQDLLLRNMAFGGTALFVVCGVALLWLTHRIAGPVLRMRGFIDKKGLSNVKELRFRKGDFVGDTGKKAA